MSRDLDAAIAEALGYEVEGPHIIQTHRDKAGPWRCGYPIPPWSEDGNAMLELDKEMQERGYLLLVYSNGGVYYTAEYSHKAQIEGGDRAFWAISRIGDEYYQDGDTMPEAVALAAYKALTGKGWQE